MFGANIFRLKSIARTYNQVQKMRIALKGRAKIVRAKTIIGILSYEAKRGLNYLKSLFLKNLKLAPL